MERMRVRVEIVHYVTQCYTLGPYLDMTWFYLENTSYIIRFLDVEREGLSIERQGSEGEGVVSFSNTDGAPYDNLKYV